MAGRARLTQFLDIGTIKIDEFAKRWQLDVEKRRELYRMLHAALCQDERHEQAAEVVNDFIKHLHIFNSSGNDHSVEKLHRDGCEQGQGRCTGMRSNGDCRSELILFWLFVAFNRRQKLGTGSIINHYLKNIYQYMITFSLMLWFNSDRSSDVQNLRHFCQPWTGRVSPIH